MQIFCWSRAVPLNRVGDLQVASGLNNRKTRIKRQRVALSKLCVMNILLHFIP
jgi:hypothetical protein